MAITNESALTSDSSWFKIMQNIAKDWEKFSEINNYSSDGSYSPYLVQFTLSSSCHTIRISGKRSLATNGDASYHDGVFIERLLILIKNPTLKERNHLSIHKSGILNVLRKKLRNTQVFKQFYLSYNKESFLLQLKQLGLMDMPGFHSLRINKKGVKLNFVTLPSPQHIQKVFEFLSHLK